MSVLVVSPTAPSGGWLVPAAVPPVPLEVPTSRVRQQRPDPIQPITIYIHLDVATTGSVVNTDVYERIVAWIEDASQSLPTLTEAWQYPSKYISA